MEACLDKQLNGATKEESAYWLYMHSLLLHDLDALATRVFQSELGLFMPKRDCNLVHTLEE